MIKKNLWIVLQYVICIIGCIGLIGCASYKKDDILKHSEADYKGWHLRNEEGVVYCRVQALDSDVLIMPLHCWDRSFHLYFNEWFYPLDLLELLSSSNKADYAVFKIKEIKKEGSKQIEKGVHWGQVYANETLWYKGKRIRVVSMGRSVWVESFGKEPIFCPSDSGSGFLTKNGFLAGILISGGNLSGAMVDLGNGECFTSAVMLPMSSISWRNK